MTVAMTIHLTYNREKDGSLAQFRAKYEQLRDHLLMMQVKGILPRGDIRWSVKGDWPRPPQTPVAVRQYPILVHRQGTVFGDLEQERLVG